MLVRRRGLNAAAVQTLIDADQLFGLTHIPGRYHDTAGAVGAFGAPTSVAVVANFLYLAPFRADAPTGYDRMAINVTGAGAAGKLGRMSVLTMGADGLPDALFADSGTFLVDAIAEALITVAVPTTYGRWYWLAFQSDGAPSVFKYNANPAVGLLGWPSGTSVARHYGVVVARTFGAIVATLTGTAWTYDTAPLAVRLRAI